MNKAKNIITIMLILITISSGIVSVPVCAKNEITMYNQEKILEVAAGIINQKKIDNGSESNGNLINSTFLELAGTTPGDWLPIGISRLGIADDYNGYLAVIKEVVEKRYEEPGKLSAAKSTEWHRISLAVLAMGGDPTALGRDESGQPINLIADGTYNRGKVASLGRQGINGWIWGLIALDSKRYEVPKDAYTGRDDIIIEILRQQLSDGGFTLSGKISDPDITAMALQALSPYYNNEKIYSYKQKTSEEYVNKTVRQVADEALECLSKLQLPTGDFKSWDTQNVESTNQVVVALCSLGIDPQSDKRFIKNGNTLINGIMRYRIKDGGFVHSYSYDEKNPTSLPGQSNTMASEQTLYTMAAIVRQMKGQRTLYDFRAEQSRALKERIESLEKKIVNLSDKSDKITMENLLKDFYSIPENERNYVINYWTLSDKSKKIGIDIEAIAGKTQIIESQKDRGDSGVILCFTDADTKAVNELPKPLTTEQYVLVATLLEKLKSSEDFDQKENCLEKLQTASAEIAKIQAEIDAINAEVLETIYPFDSISLKDKSTIDNIAKRYNALSDYDKAKIDRWDDVINAKTKADNLFRAIIISVILLSMVTVFLILVIKRICARKRKKQIQMDELAVMYEDER